MRDFSLITSKVLIDLTAVDHVSPATVRFHLHYFLLSMQYNMRFQICTIVADKAQVLTSTKVFLSSLWLEREVWNMFGIRFMRNDTIRCILTDYGFKSHPLVKNFPMTGYWQYRYDEARRVILKYPVKLMQEYRRFTLSVENHEVLVDFLKWNKLPNDELCKYRTSTELSLSLEKGITYDPESWEKLWHY